MSSEDRNAERVYKTVLMRLPMGIRTLLGIGERLFLLHYLKELVYILSMP